MPFKETALCFYSGIIWNKPWTTTKANSPCYSFIKFYFHNLWCGLARPKKFLIVFHLEIHKTCMLCYSGPSLCCSIRFIPCALPWVLDKINIKFTATYVLLPGIQKQIDRTIFSRYISLSGLTPYLLFTHPSVRIGCMELLDPSWYICLTKLYVFIFYFNSVNYCYDLKAFCRACESGSYTHQQTIEYAKPPCMLNHGIASRSGCKASSQGCRILLVFEETGLKSFDVTSCRLYFW